MEACIVVIDDEPEVLDLVCEVLEEDGFAVVPVDHPDRVEPNAQVSAALVLIDLMLPGVNGIDVARALRSGVHRHTPMVAMSASRGMLEAASQSGLFQAVLPKPFDLDELLTCVDTFIEDARSA